MIDSGSEGVLTCDTFESVDEIEEAIGEVLQSCCDDSDVSTEEQIEKQIKEICDKLFDAINVSVIQSVLSLRHLKKLSFSLIFF